MRTKRRSRGSMSQKRGGGDGDGGAWWPTATEAYERPRRPAEDGCCPG